MPCSPLPPNLPWWHSVSSLIPVHMLQSSEHADQIHLLFSLALFLFLLFVFSTPSFSLLLSRFPHVPSPVCFIHLHVQYSFKSHEKVKWEELGFWPDHMFTRMQLLWLLDEARGATDLHLHIITAFTITFRHLKQCGLYSVLCWCGIFFFHHKHNEFNLETHFRVLLNITIATGWHLAAALSPTFSGCTTWQIFSRAESESEVWRPWHDIHIAVEVVRVCVRCARSGTEEWDAKTCWVINIPCGCLRKDLKLVLPQWHLTSGILSLSWESYRTVQWFNCEWMDASLHQITPCVILPLVQLHDPDPFIIQYVNAWPSPSKFHSIFKLQQLIIARFDGILATNAVFSLFESSCSNRMFTLSRQCYWTFPCWHAIGVSQWHSKASDQNILIKSKRRWLLRISKRMGVLYTSTFSVILSEMRSMQSSNLSKQFAFVWLFLMLGGSINCPI